MTKSKADLREVFFAYIRDDGAQMLEIEPHCYVNAVAARALGLVGRRQIQDLQAA